MTANAVELRFWHVAGVTILGGFFTVAVAWFSWGRSIDLHVAANAEEHVRMEQAVTKIATDLHETVERQRAVETGIAGMLPRLKAIEDRLYRLEEHDGLPHLPPPDERGGP